MTGFTNPLVLGVLALGAGALLPVQAGANAQLARALRSPFAATALQLTIAAALLAAVLATDSAGAFARLAQIVWWHAAGGAASAMFVLATILLYPRLGAVLTVGLFVAGQTLASLLLDGFGLLGVPARGFSPEVLAGAALVFGGAWLMVRGSAAGQQRPVSAGWIGLALLASAGLPVQAAVNALLRQDLAAPFAVGTVSFVVAAVIMTALALVLLAVPETPRPEPSGLVQAPWWGWLGGPVGAAYVTAMFLATPAIGAASTVGLTIAGQQLVALLVDRFGWLRLPRRAVTGLRLAGVLVLVAGVAVLTAARG
jgi:transporter family-2 protein